MSKIEVVKAQIITQIPNTLSPNRITGTERWAVEHMRARAHARIGKRADFNILDVDNNLRNGFNYLGLILEPRFEDGGVVDLITDDLIRRYQKIMPQKPELRVIKPTIPYSSLDNSRSLVQNPPSYPKNMLWEPYYEILNDQLNPNFVRIRPIKEDPQILDNPTAILEAYLLQLLDLQKEMVKTPPKLNIICY